ncbi:hypothetical protein [Haloarcula sp. JP-L23]|uniref:hypothetical protein n=1 Tax=Haloarcula sp. JP-L23 TaxID=2716717 RepID=UPI00140EEB66|nr:hypothetical protein G9465_04940 [Haloarcula sp. JP-L23]
MSGHIKSVLWERLDEYLEASGVRGGQILAARFDQGEYPKLMRDAIWEQDVCTVRSLTIDSVTNDVAAVEKDGTTIYVQRIYTDTTYPDDDEAIDGLQGFGTTLRNLVAREQNGEDISVLLILDTQSDLDTYNPTNRLTDTGGPLDLSAIRASLLTPRSDHSIPQQAVLAATERLIENKLGSPGDSAFLADVAAIRAAVDDEDVSSLQRRLGELPQMVNVDTLPDSWFDLEPETSPEEVWKFKKLYGRFVDAHDHATRLRDAFRGGTNSLEHLREDYREDFVQEVLVEGDWRGFGLAEIEKNERIRRKVREQSESDQSSDEEADSDESDDDEDDEAESESEDTDAEDSEDADDVTDPVPNGVSVDGSAEDSRIFEQHESPLTDADFRWSGLCKTEEETLEATLEFDKDLSEPFNVRIQHSDETPSYAVSGDAVTATVELPDERPQYISVEVYVDRDDARGYPTSRFDIAVLPDWCFDATAEVTLDVDFEEQGLVFHGPDVLSLVPAPPRNDRDKKEQTILEDGQHVALTRPTDLFAQVPHDETRLECVLQSPATEEAGEAGESDGSDAVGVKLIFYDESSDIDSKDVVFPLFLDAIATTSDVGKDDSVKLVDEITIQPDDSTISARGVRFQPTKSALQAVIQVEHEITESGSPNPRIVSGDSLQPGVKGEFATALPDPIQAAYDRLFEHFDTRGTIPSVDPWDSETKDRVRAVVEAFSDLNPEHDDYSEETYQSLQRVGTVETEGDSQYVWLTSFHPLMLAYGLRIADWRDDDLAPNGKTGGFENDRFTAQLDPTGLLPYKSPREGSCLRAEPLERHSLWAQYAPVHSSEQTEETRTPSWFRSAFVDRVEDFLFTFRPIFELHPHRQLTVNVANLGDLRPLVNGLVELYDNSEDPTEEIPPIELRIYGEGRQGTALDTFFSDQGTADAEERVLDQSVEDSLLEQLKERVSYTHRSEPPANADSAHISFFRNVLSETYRPVSMGRLPNGLFKDGLLPVESLEKPSDASQEYQMGFGVSTAATGRVQQVAKIANRIEAHTYTSGDYSASQKLIKEISATRGAALDHLSSESVWAVYVDPIVEPDFFTGSDEMDSIVIQYSDEHDPNSPGYDIITTTNRRTVYQQAIQTGAERIDQYNVTDTETLLLVMTAIQGDAVTELQHANPQTIKQRIGEVGGMALARTMLRRELGDYAWLPVPLAEHVQHDRAHRQRIPGVLQMDVSGPLSDDLLFVGLPDSLEDPVKFWLVEAKGGSGADTGHGVQQIRNAREAMTTKFDRDQSYADTELLYSAFGRVIVDLANRMRTYNIISSDDQSRIHDHRESLLEGEYDVSFLSGVNNELGDVINTVDELGAQLEIEEDVRVATVPITILELLGEPDTDPSTIVENFPFDQYGF